MRISIFLMIVICISLACACSAAKRTVRKKENVGPDLTDPEVQKIMSVCRKMPLSLGDEKQIRPGYVCVHSLDGRRYLRISEVYAGIPAQLIMQSQSTFWSRKLTLL